VWGKWVTSSDPIGPYTLEMAKASSVEEAKEMAAVAIARER